MLGKGLGWFVIGIVLLVGLGSSACSSEKPAQQERQEQIATQSEGGQTQDQAQGRQAAEPAEPVQEQAVAQAQQAEQQQAQPAEQEAAEAQQAAAPEQAEQDRSEPQAETEPPVADDQAQSSQPSRSSQASARSLDGVRGIVDPSNTGWPREVEGLNGIVSIPAKPERIITASIGHDEITLALVPIERLVAVGDVSKIATYSNIADWVQDKAVITRDPETIIAEAPDVVVTSPFYPAEGVDALERAGIPVVQTELVQTPESRINAILLLGYIYGEEDRAWEFADEIQARFDALVGVTGSKSDKPRVLALTQYSDTLWVAGADSTEGGVIDAAGGINAAAEAGIQGNQTTSLEGVIAMTPDVIIIAQPIEFGAAEFHRSLFDNQALAEVPAIKGGAVHVVESKHFTTLSHWNIRGAEDLARILWPDDFPDPPAQGFSLAGQE